MSEPTPQSTPEWVTTFLETTLAAHPTWPGIQLTVTSAHCNLDFTTSIHSFSPTFSTNPPLLDHTPWRLASITKTFTAVAILNLASQSLLDLHAPAVNYLPSWATDLLTRSQGSLHASQVTTSQLLHHTSGLGDFASTAAFKHFIFTSPSHTWTPRSVIEFSNTHSHPSGAPGEKFHYSDTGYTYLGLILTHVTSLPLAAAIRSLAGIDTVSMPSTYLELLEPAPPNLPPRAGQYHGTTDTTGFNPTFDLYGAGGLVTNSADLNRWGRALMEGRLLDAKHMETLYELEASRVYGAGVVKYVFQGLDAWGHTGFWRTWLYWVPELDLVVSGASNQAESEQFDIDGLVKQILERGCRPRSEMEGERIEL